MLSKYTISVTENSRLCTSPLLSQQLNQFSREIIKTISVIENSRLCTSPLLSQQLNQFSREMIDLLKQQPQGRMPFSKFIPTYHHFFSRQCRVADYGYNRLKDLFEAVPHVIQVHEKNSRDSGVCLESYWLTPGVLFRQNIIYSHNF